MNTRHRYEIVSPSLGLNLQLIWLKLLQRPLHHGKLCMCSVQYKIEL